MEQALPENATPPPASPFKLLLRAMVVSSEETKTKSKLVSPELKTFSRRHFTGGKNQATFYSFSNVVRVSRCDRSLGKTEGFEVAL